MTRGPGGAVHARKKDGSGAVREVVGMPGASGVDGLAIDASNAYFEYDACIYSVPKK